MNRKIGIYTLVLCCSLLGGCTRDNTENQAKLSQEEAKTIALEHAGLATDQITFTKSEMDKDYAQEHYDIEFHTKDGMEYDYEIDAHNGNILEWKAERETR